MGGYGGGFVDDIGGLPSDDGHATDHTQGSGDAAAQSQARSSNTPPAAAAPMATSSETKGKGGSQPDAATPRQEAGSTPPAPGRVQASAQSPATARAGASEVGTDMDGASRPPSPGSMQTHPATMSAFARYWKRQGDTSAPARVVLPAAEAVTEFRQKTKGVAAEPSDVDIAMGCMLRDYGPGITLRHLLESVGVVGEHVDENRASAFRVARYRTIKKLKQLAGFLANENRGSDPYGTEAILFSFVGSRRVGFVPWGQTRFRFHDSSIARDPDLDAGSLDWLQDRAVAESLSQAPTDRQASGVDLLATSRSAVASLELSADQWLRETLADAGFEANVAAFWQRVAILCCSLVRRLFKNEHDALLLDLVLSTARLAIAGHEESSTRYGPPSSGRLDPQKIAARLAEANACHAEVLQCCVMYQPSMQAARATWEKAGPSGAVARASARISEVLSLAAQCGGASESEKDSDGGVMAEGGENDKGGGAGAAASAAAAEAAAGVTLVCTTLSGVDMDRAEAQLAPNGRTKLFGSRHGSGVYSELLLAEAIRRF